MKIIEVATDDLVISPELTRSGSAKLFEERLRSSIDEIGLAEPIKVAPMPEGGYLVIDGMIRLSAIRSIRERDNTRFKTVPSYVLNYDRRFEIRYQTDVYQDLLPSQLAGLVEHLHRAEHVRKVDIARYIGVSPATLRNYTGVWRLLQRGGLFRALVSLMDVDIIPSSNPYAWLRLTATGLRRVIEEHFSGGEAAQDWMARVAAESRQGTSQRYPVKFVESVTDALPAEMYRVGEDVRAIKRDLGLRRAINHVATNSPTNFATPSHTVNSAGGSNADSSNATTRSPSTAGVEASRHLAKVYRYSREPALKSVAASLQEYLQ